MISAAIQTRLAYHTVPRIEGDKMDGISEGMEVHVPVQLQACEAAVTSDQVAGDWNVFRRRCAFLDATPVLDAQQAIAAKRQYALDYLGERAQAHGGVFRATKPTVFTEDCVAALAKRNLAARFARYPWLAQLLALISALDDAQYSVVARDEKVIAFPNGSPTRITPA